MVHQASDWRYGDAIERWPVQPGEHWRAGIHHLHCLDALSSGAALIMGTTPYALLYTDPPWNPRIHTAFRKQAGAPLNVPYEAILSKVVELARAARTIT